MYRKKVHNKRDSALKWILIVPYHLWSRSVLPLKNVTVEICFYYFQTHQHDVFLEDNLKRYNINI